MLVSKCILLRVDRYNYDLVLINLKQVKLLQKKKKKSHKRINLNANEKIDLCNNLFLRQLLYNRRYVNVKIEIFN